MNPRTILLSLAVLGAAGAVAGAGAFSAFSKTTSNDNNNVTAGDVTIGDNDAGSAAYSMPNAKPGDTDVHCIKVTYSGSLNSTVKLYRGATGGTAIDSDVNLVITKGTGSAFNCSDFTPAASGSSVYNGTLAGFTGTSWSNGTSLTNGAGSATWVAATGGTPDSNSVVTYKIQATLSASAPSSDQGLSTGTHSFTWEAQNN